MKTTCLVLFAGVFAVAGCGGSDDSGPAQREPSALRAGAVETGQEKEEREKEKGRGRAIRVADSEFGSILVDGRRQAIYIFENDRRGETVCYGECAKAWPPVLTSGKPRAGAGVRRKLLGTVERRNGKRQVTYAGKPLYFYAHEAPGEVRCHNVNLNGGFWWVIGRNGARRP